MSNLNIVEEIYRFVLQLPDDRVAGLTIKMLAKHFEVNRCHISRRFRNERGMTLATFILRRKLLLAEQRLAMDPDITVKQLASHLGYADYQYFISRFKEHFGESPGRYRKLYAGLVEPGL
jgi:two-component system response regulator YesN